MSGCERAHIIMHNTMRHISLTLIKSHL